jgi:membrane associated rhomboid family serine protease
MAEVERIGQRAEGQPFSTEPPDELWKRLAALFGIPVLVDDTRDARLPWVTWSIAAAIVVVLALTWSDLERATRTWGLIPAEWTRAGGLTLLTSFFLHAGLLHAAGNLYFLIVFGDNVEAHLGWRRYLLLIGVADLAANACHILVDPRGTVPVVGASGGISAVIVFFALKFPRARLALGLWRGPWIRYMQFPAWFGLGMWIVLQFIGVAQQLGGFTNVSAAAHLGGAAVGVLAWVVWRREDA